MDRGKISEKPIRYFVLQVLFLNVVFAFFISKSAWSQKKSVCSEKLLHKSYLQVRNNKYHKAINTLRKTITDNPNCAEAYCRLADLSYRVNDTFYAMQYMQKAIAVNPEKGMQALNALADLMRNYNDHQLAIRMMEAVLVNNKMDKVKKINLQSTLALEQNKSTLLNNYVTSKPQIMGGAINQATTQCFPSLTLDGSKLYFTRVINELNEDFFVAAITDTCLGWNEAVNIGSPPNTGGPDGASQISADGNYLFFTKCDQRSLDGVDGGGCDVFFCYKTIDGWSPPQKFKATINSMHFEGQPCINSLNNEMYFVSDRPGGFGGKDIYSAKFVNGLWQSPVNLGPTINTTANEESPFIHPDNATLYFVSDNKKGLGGEDIYVAKKNEMGKFNTPANLGSPINTSANENSICVAANGVDAIIASNIGNVKGNFQLYTVGLPTNAKAKATYCVTGKILDKKSKEILPNTTLQIFNSKQELIHRVQSNVGDASFTFPLLTGDNYTCVVDAKENYKNYSCTINLAKDTLSNALVLNNIYLKKSDLIDTLYSSSFFGSENSDTTIYNISHPLEAWNSQSTDSIVLYATLTYNEFIDTCLLYEICMNDSLKNNYVQGVYDARSKENKEVLEYFNFCQKYLKDKKTPIKTYVTNARSDIWSSRERYRLQMVVVEYY